MHICRHGYKGNIPKGDEKECPYNHPQLCKFYINFGKCKFGEDFESYLEELKPGTNPDMKVEFILDV